MRLRRPASYSEREEAVANAGRAGRWLTAHDGARQRRKGYVLRGDGEGDVHYQVCMSVCVYVCEYVCMQICKYVFPGREEGARDIQRKRSRSIYGRGKRRLLGSVLEHVSKVSLSQLLPLAENQPPPVGRDLNLTTSNLPPSPHLLCRSRESPHGPAALVLCPARIRRGTSLVAAPIPRGQ